MAELLFDDSDPETRTKSDPDNCANLAKGFPTKEEASAAIHAFWDEFYELRNKHRLADVLVVARLVVQGSGDCMLTMHAGNEMYEEALAAFAYGKATSSRQERIMKLMSDAGSVINQPRKRK